MILDINQRMQVTEGKRQGQSGRIISRPTSEKKSQTYTLLMDDGHGYVVELKNLKEIER